MNEKIKLYKHEVQYYETDKMGVTHHSNYIRWMEEARIDLLKQIGWPYDRLEAEGIISPILKVECQYKKSTTFADVIYIEAMVEEFNGIRLNIKYIMKKQGKDDIIFIGESQNCFLDEQSRPINVKNKYPELYRAIMEHKLKM